jgi:transposase
VRSCLNWLSSYSLGGLSRLLRAWGCGLRQARVQQYSPDPDYTSKVSHLLKCLSLVAQAPDTYALVFLDEMGYTAWPEPGLQWTLRAPASPPVAYKRLPQAHFPTSGPTSNNRQWRIVGALNAWSGQVEYLDDYKVGRRQLIRFYKQLAQRYQNFQHVFVVQDNWPVHKHEEVSQALSQWPQLEAVWLPTYAPWLNPIEKLWRWLRQDVLKMHRLAGDFNGLRQDVRGFLDGFANGSSILLRYVGLQGDGLLASALHYCAT